jgi:hypothetical protein
MIGHAHTTAVDVWVRALDELEETIELQERFLCAIDSTAAAIGVPAPFRPSADLPPMPNEVASRARKLLARNDAVIQRAQRMSERSRLRPSRPMPRRRNTTPATFDRLA